MRNNITLILLLSFCFLMIPARQVEASKYDSFWNMIYENFEFMPEYHIDADILMFFNHKNSYFKERYYIENNTNLNFVFISFRDIVFSTWYFEFQTGMGQTPGNVVFDPMDINFGLVPALEFRTPIIDFQCGLNHRCYHEIDRKDFPTIYLNQFFVGAGSKNKVLFNYWNNLTEKEGWTYKNRVSWNLTWGYYLRKFFGIVKESTINGENRFVQDFTFDSRFAFYRRRSWIFDIYGKTVIGKWRNLPGEPVDEGVYFKQDASLEASFRRGKKGAMIFLTYTLDKYPLFYGAPRFSKDQLIQFGFRFFI